MKISKRMKIAGLVIAVTIVAFAAIMIVGMSDVMSGTATGSELLKPDGAATGKALVVYNPGLSGAPRDVATQIANDLKGRGYEVMLAGVKSKAAANFSGYDVVVAGGPIYGGKVSPSIYSYLQALNPPGNVKVGAFAVGGNADQAFPDGPGLEATVVLPWGGNIDQQRAGFVAGLLK